MDLLLSLLRQTPRPDWQWKLDNADGWSRNKAITFANCALLAYNDPAIVKQHLQDRGFTDVTFIQSESPGVDTQAFVAARPGDVVVSFRGTEPTNPVDLFTDFTTARVAFSDKFQFTGWGKIWGGWADGVQAVLPQILEKLKACDDDRHALWITGHSLGGALAMVLAAIVANLPEHPIQGVYTYGQPRVGDPEFCQRYAKALGEKTFRHVNNNDLVPRVPPRRFSRMEQQVYGAGGLFDLAALADAFRNRKEIYEYDHVGKLCLLLPQGGCTSDLDEEAKHEPAFLKNDRDNLFAGLELAQLTLEAASRIKDHAPINPVTHNGYIERLEGLPESAGLS
jgi:triacylglycerol lipase